MFKQKTSIVFINATDNETKSVQIPTTVLQQWKYWLLIISLTLFLIIYLLAMVINVKINTYHISDHKDIKKTNQIESIDIKRIKKNFESLDESISRINYFMEKRGLKSFELQNLDKDKGFQITELDVRSDLYVQHILAMEKFIQNTPIGKPSEGKQTSGFGARENPFGGSVTESHKGVDFSGTFRSAVKSTAEGKVTFAGQKGGYGNCVIIRHLNGFETLYGHLSKINVKNGQIVKIGTIIGELGNTGRSTGPHLHYEIILNGKKIDPQNYLTL
jgi:murein DD-endopeptidase MepM/ murein hydrolase activator NlpD